MPRLPDRFDLFVRKARACPDPARQVDYVLGALFALPAWYFLQAGSPLATAMMNMEGVDTALLFTDSGRVEEIIHDQLPPGSPADVKTMPVIEAVDWCARRRAALLVNPGEDAVLIPFDQLETFTREWLQRRETHASGFWIPNMTSEEEDFWQEQGL